MHGSTWAVTVTFFEIDESISVGKGSIHEAQHISVVISDQSESEKELKPSILAGPLCEL